MTKSSTVLVGQAGQRGKRLQEPDHLAASPHGAHRELADDERMRQHGTGVQALHEIAISLPEMIDPGRRIDDRHRLGV